MRIAIVTALLLALSSSAFAAERIYYGPYLISGYTTYYPYGKYATLKSWCRNNTFECRAYFRYFQPSERLMVVTPIGLQYVD
jgi:hypothetical protein